MEAVQHKTSMAAQTLQKTFPKGQNPRTSKAAENGRTVQPSNRSKMAAIYYSWINLVDDRYSF